MIKITNKNDYEKIDVSNLPNVFKEYVIDYTNEMLSRFSSLDLKPFGEIYIAETSDDFSNFPKLSKPFNSENATFFTNVGLVENNQTVNLLQFIFFIGNFAINIICESKTYKEYVNSMNKQEG